MINEHLRDLIKSRNEKTAVINAEGVKLIEARNELDKNHKSDCPCGNKGDNVAECTDETYKNGMMGLQDRIKVQQVLREEVLALDELIEAGREIKTLEEITEGEDPTKALGDNTSLIAKQSLYPERKPKFLSQIGNDFHAFLEKTKFNTVDTVKGRALFADTLKDGSTFQGAASFYATFGKNQTELHKATKSIGVEVGNWDNIEPLVKSVRDSATKSMFTQHPIIGRAEEGDPGSLYDPTAVFPGNTGGLCEYLIDDSIEVLPYPEASFLDCIPVRQISKAYLLYVRQTLRVNNAAAVAESVILAGTNNPTGAAVNLPTTKPESEFGFSQAKTYTLTFADTVPVSEEFLEDCPSVADIVETQLMENVRQEFYDQIINGDGTATGANPELLGLLAQVGVSTRVHKGAASFMGNTMGAGALDDTIRDTIERAIFDGQAYGYNIDCVIISHNDYVTMAMMKDGDDHKLYTEAELNTIRGAKIRSDTRMPVGTAIAGAFRQTVQILIRRAIRLDIGWIDKQFVQDMLTLRATMRGGLLVKVPHALIRITALNT